MKRNEMIRGAVAAIALGAPPAALADGGSMVTTTGWWSLLIVAGIVGVLFVVHKKLG